MRPDPRRKQMPKLIKRARHEYPMRLVLEFDRPVSLAEANQLARRLLDHTQVQVSQVPTPEGFFEARLTCAGLRRSFRLLGEGTEDQQKTKPAPRTDERGAD